MEYDSSRPPPLPPSETRHRPGYSNPPPPPPEAERRGGIWPNFLQSCLVAGCATILAPVVLIGGLFAVGLVLFFSGVDKAVSRFGESASNTVVTVTLRPGDSGGAASGIDRERGTIAVVNVQGAIDGGGSPLDGNGSLAFVAEQLRLASEDDDVRGVLLQIDSPGGGLTASDLLHHEVGELRKTGKPVVAWAGSMMASGGYYIAVAADRIMASPTATVGSIGVIMQHVQAEKLLSKLGVTVDPITSGERKDLGSPFREMTPEERKLLQDYIDISHSRFVDIVAEGRDMPRDDVAALADGGIMGADAALDKGLIDSIGYVDDAVALLEGEIGESGMKIIGYRRVFSLADAFSQAGANAAAAALEAVRGADAPKAMTVY